MKSIHHTSLYIVKVLFTRWLMNNLLVIICHTICQNHLLCRHLELVLNSLQTAKEVLGLAEDGKEPRGISINHNTEDKLLPLGADPFKLAWNRDEPLHLLEIARLHLFKRRTELQTALPIYKKYRNQSKEIRTKCKNYLILMNQ